MNIRLKATLIFTAVFLAGCFTGGALVLGYTRSVFLNRIASGDVGMRHAAMAGLVRRLGLDEAQRQRIEPMVEQMQRELFELKSRHRPEVLEVVNRNLALIRAELTPEQAARLEELRQKVIRRRLERRPGRFRGKGRLFPGEAPENTAVDGNPTAEPASPPD